jgi:hypothetical protein
VVINLGSTMAHDFAVLNKPCLYLNYNPVPNSTLKVEDVYKFQHFRSMKNLDAVGWIDSKEELGTMVLKAINTPELVGKDRIEWMKTIVKYPLEANSKNLANALEKICTSV